MGKILVTGSGGFIGSQLIKDLLISNFDVLGLARSSCKKLAKQIGTNILCHDLLTDIPDLKGIDSLVHLATSNDVMTKQNDSGLNLSVIALDKLLNKAVIDNVQNFILISTIQVFGENLNGAITLESPKCLNSMYSTNHLLSELLCKHYALSSDLNIIILRPPNLIGYHNISTIDRGTLVPMCFHEDAYVNKTVRLLSSGNQNKNFLSVPHISKVVIALLTDFPCGFNEYNLSSDYYSSIIDMANLFIEIWTQVTNQDLSLITLSNIPKCENKFIIKAHLIKGHDITEYNAKDNIKLIIKKNIESYLENKNER